MTLGKIEIVAACNRGDGEDQSKWLFTEVVVVACVATVVKGFNQI